MLCAHDWHCAPLFQTEGLLDPSSTPRSCQLRTLAALVSLSPDSPTEILSTSL